jgi:alkylation response protein AidB-like acyl-CoA dehydrogenase
MSVILNDDQLAVREGAQRFAAANFGPARRKALRETADGFDRDALKKSADDGWLAITVDADHGGAGQGLQEACLVAEAFGRELAPVPAASVIASLKALEFFGNAAESIRAAATAGDSLLSPVLCNGKASINATRSGAGYRLSGLAKGVCDPASAAVFLVECNLEGSPALALVARDAAGVSIVSRRIADGGSGGEIKVTDASVDAGLVLAGEAAAACLAQLRMQISVLSAAELIGIMEVVLARTVEHLKTRQQFGRPLGSFQSLQFRMADVHSAVSLSRALTYEAARLADAGAAAAGLTASIAIAKSSEAAILATRTFIQMLGAMGFTDEHDAGLYLKRALVLTTAFGTALDHRRAIGNVTLASDAKEIRFREDSADDRAFRQQVREWLDANLPKELRHLPTRPTFEEAGFWHRKLYERGWIAPNWPKQYGGMEGTVAQQIILAEELGRIGAPEISGQAIGHFGPILQAFGTPEQKQAHLPQMLSGEKIWCQGYSEPSSGSDLASLRTRAVADGDHLVINGSKIWTTWAHYADWMFCLVRTNPDVKKQEGLTFVMIDMKTKGINPRPIRTITGEDEFAEVFFDDVRVPLSNVIGKIDGGWKVATALLEKERLNGANPQKCSYLLGKVKTAARSSGAIEDPAFRDRLVRAEIDYVALCATYAQIVKITETDTRTNADFAFAKLVAAELLQELCELMMLALGADGASIEAVDIGGVPLNPGLTYLQTRRATIYGGTAEIQRMLMARRVLGLV